MDLKRILMIVISFLLVLGFIVSSFYLVLNLYTINENTKNMRDDMSLSRVSRIDSRDTVYLQDGTVAEDIESYVKVNRGSGTWYSEEGRLLVVEISFKDISGIIVLNLIYIILIGAVSVVWYRRIEGRLWAKRATIGLLLGYAIIVVEISTSLIKDVMNIV